MIYFLQIVAVFLCIIGFFVCVVNASDEGAEIAVLGGFLAFLAGLILCGICMVTLHLDEICRAIERKGADKPTPSVPPDVRIDRLRKAQPRKKPPTG